MKKLVLLCLLAAAAFGVWKFAGQSNGGSDSIADLESRLTAAERSYQSAGRASGMSGVDTSADAEAALAEVGRIETDARELGRKATSGDEKARIRKLLDRLASVRHRIG